MFINEKVVFASFSITFFVSVLSILIWASSIGACVCASKTKYKNCLCGFVYPNGDKKLRSIVLYMLYFGAMPFHNFFNLFSKLTALRIQNALKKIFWDTLISMKNYIIIICYTKHEKRSIFGHILWILYFHILISDS